MENKHSDQNQPAGEESPISVLVKITVTTLATLAFGWLIMYLGLI